MSYSNDPRSHKFDDRNTEMLIAHRVNGDFGFGEYLNDLISGFLDLKLNSAFNLEPLGEIFEFIHDPLIILVPHCANQPKL